MNNVLLADWESFQFWPLSVTQRYARSDIKRSLNSFDNFDFS